MVAEVNGRVWNSVYLSHFYSSIVRFYLHLWAGVRVLILDHLVVFLSDHCNLDQELSMNNHKFFTGLGWIFTINSYNINYFLLIYLQTLWHFILDRALKNRIMRLF